MSVYRLDRPDGTTGWVSVSRDDFDPLVALGPDWRKVTTRERIVHWIFRDPRFSFFDLMATSTIASILVFKILP